MSTRANIIVKDSYDKILLYRHSGGYPEGTLPTLKKFMSWANEGKIRRNAEQASGWLVVLGFCEYYKIENHKINQPVNFDEAAELVPGNWKVGAYEPCITIHGDIEYLYTCDLEKIEIRYEEDGKEVVIRNFEE